jgi:hypothetical protein
MLYTLPIGLMPLLNISPALAEIQVIRGHQLAGITRLPLCALSGRNMGQVHGVDFLESALAGFHEEEVDYDCGEKVAASEDVAEGKVNVSGDERGEEGEHEIPEPNTL